ncbi:TetR/AcrR family transcriptional regulator [Neptunomonas antarctica]|uniref:Transcriptional regulator, TetR family n=1 Tax=Neptunomonas antarctica TaxID=619304 RepID=A0A1N7JVV8_9GAMM|nr:TetR/AcrR family transcriptional regulator [Neptunomonas antarctica]SIS53482.1 transcriptional regulator, TetR family [Neptunomonas antarctica]
MARGRPSKKQEILDAARQLFAASGYQGTSIGLVVQTAGVSKPTVYNNFPTKQALLSALMEQLLVESQAFRQRLWKDKHISVADGLIKAFEDIASVPEYLAVYRISYGERHKLDEQTYLLFKRFDQSLQLDCRCWLETHTFELQEGAMLAIIAICREGILIPALSGDERVPRAVIEAGLGRFL